jgi:outer membrane biosynthesis protein TonB
MVVRLALVASVVLWGSLLVPGTSPHQFACSALTIVPLTAENKGVQERQGCSSVQGENAAILKNPKYPESACKDHIEGTVYLDVTVDPRGNVTEVTVQKGVREHLDQPAL